MSEGVRQIPLGASLRKIARGDGETFDVAGARFTWKVKNADTGHEWVAASSGETVVVPINGLHAFYNRTSTPARLLSISNQLHQGFFDAVAAADREAPFAGMPAPEAMARVVMIARGYDMHFMPFQPPPPRG